MSESCFVTCATFMSGCTAATTDRGGWGARTTDSVSRREASPSPYLTVPPALFNKTKDKVYSLEEEKKRLGQSYVC